MELKDFIINIGPNGTFRPSGSYQTLPEDIDTIFERYEIEKIKKISIYFHGGLVNEKSGMETAIKMGKHLSDAGEAPLCFVWETGLMETISSNLTKIHDTKLFNKLIRVLLKKLTEKLGVDKLDSKGTGQLLTDEQIDDELLKSFPFESFNYDHLNDNGKGATTMVSLSKNEAEFIRSLEADFTYLIQSDLEFTKLITEAPVSVKKTEQDNAKGIISTAAFIKHVAIIAFKVIKRFIDKRDHDLYPTIIEEILREFYVAELGSWVWNNMKIKAKDMWQDNKSTSGLNRYAGRYLLDKLMNYVEKNNDVEVNLIGHSAGSIAICNLLNVSSKINPKMVFNKIVFMAPACRVDLFNSEMVLNKHRFEHFRMFTMEDQFESKDSLVPFLYTHSLLYLISGILEEEGKEFDAYLLGLQRHIIGNYPYDTQAELISTNQFLFEDSKKRVVFSRTETSSLEGMKSNSVSHGGFDDDEDTVKSILYFLNESV